MGKSSKSIEAGGAFVRLFSEDSALRKGLAASGKHLKTWGAGLSKVGGIVTGLGSSVAAPIITAAWQYMNAGDKLSKAMQATGVRAEELSSLQYAAEQMGASFEDVRGALGSLRGNVAGAIAGSQGAIDALRSVGLSVRDLRDLSPDQQFRVIAEQLSKIRDPALRAAAAQRIFGGSAEKLAPLLNRGARGIRELESEARSLGAVMSTEDAQGAEAMKGAFTALNYAFTGIIRVIGTAVAPLLTTVATRAAAVAAGFGAWINKNRELIATGFKIAAVVMALGAVLTVVGAGGMALGAVLGGLATIFGIIGTAIAAVGTVAAFLVSPLGLILGAVVGLLTYSGLAGSALDWLREQFGTLATGALAAFGAIGKALSAGDIGLAARVLWSYLKMEWQRGVSGLNAIWEGVKGWFQSVWADAVYGVAAIALNAWAGLKSGFMEVVRFMADAWAIFAGGILKGWHSTIGFIKKAWTRLKAMFNSDIDVDAEVKRIDAETAGKNAAADEATQSSIAARELDNDRKAELARIEQDRQGALSALAEQRAAEEAAREKARNDDLAASQEALQKAQDDYAKTLEETEALPPSTGGSSLASRLKGVEDRFAGVMPTGMASKITSTGTFSASAVRGLSNTNFDSRIASATEATARWTRTIAEKNEAPTA